MNDKFKKQLEKFQNKMLKCQQKILIVVLKDKFR